MSLLHWAIFLPLLVSAGVPASRKLFGNVHAGWVVLPVPLMLFAYFLWHIPRVQEAPVMESWSWLPSLGIAFTVYVDGLTLLFALLISGIGLLVVLYSIFYLHEERKALQRFYAYLLLFMGAMLGIVLSDNLLILYGFWEMTSVASFLLIAFWYRRERPQYGALKSMLITVFGGMGMFAGFLLLYAMTGTFSIREIIGQAGHIAEHPLMVPALLLVLLGAFTKSAQFPFHMWLPDAMEAPTPVSAYLHSATMVKAGLYLVARSSPIFASQPEWFWIVSFGGLATLLYGSVQAVRQTDLKALLAYSTISQLGLVMCLLGLGAASGLSSETGAALLYTQATAAALFHLLNHAVFKGALFLTAGIVDHETGTRDLRKLGGLIGVMPVTFSIATIGALSMAGVPPFGGFLSKEMFFTAVLNVRQMDMGSLAHWGIVVPAVAWLAGVFTFVYSLVLVVRAFGGSYSKERYPRPPHEAGTGLLVSPTILAAMALVFGLFPALPATLLVEPAMASVHPGLLASGDRFDVHIRMWHGWTAEVGMTAALIGIGTALVVLYRRSGWRRRSDDRWTLNRLYDMTLQGGVRASAGLTSLYMNGSLRTYLIYIFLFLLVVLGTTLFGLPLFPLDGSGYAPVAGYEAAAVVALGLAAAAVPFARHRIAAILFTGAVGYMVTLLFVLFRAPDLALTQVIVETVSVVLFLLCFQHLPKLTKEIESVRFKLTKALIAVCVGIAITLIALGAGGGTDFTPISAFFMEESYRLAGGKNMVNVILVDFRGFDTLLEIVVLGIASLGIYGMVKLRLEAGKQDRDEQGGNGRLPRFAPLRAPASNDVILMTVARVVIFIIMLFSICLFFAGHHAPGGGFIGGLLTAAALILFAMAFGMNAAQRVLPADVRKLTAVGLLTAALTGAGSFVFDAPFLSHAFGHVDLPVVGDTELATAVLFDLGVYVTVVGVAVTIIWSVGREGSPTWKR